MTIETKLQIEALKMLDKGEKKPGYAEDENYVYLTTDGYCAYRISRYDFFLNTDKLILMKSLSGNFSSENLSVMYELSISNEMKKITAGTLTVLKCEKFSTGINTDFLKRCIKRDCHVFAKSEKSAIYFVIDDEIYAVVMPIRL